jgi:hypothetical protein
VTGIPTACTRCALPLDANNITGVCLECKHIERDALAGFTAPEVPIEAARANFMDAFRGHYRQMDTSAVYMRGACRMCARFTARHDTGRCEWCSGPRRFPPKRSKKTTSRRREVSTITKPEGTPV